MRSGAKRDMRIAVYGASGYQGRLVAAELRRRGLDEGLVLAGRSLERLSAAAREVGLSDAELRVAGTDDVEALAASFEGADAVINCAGPFTFSGDAVVIAAIRARIHYVDTCGEQFFIKHIYDTCAESAAQAGITAVPAATDGGVPGDLLAHLLAATLGPLDELVSAHLIGLGAGPSRGSLRSMLAIRDALQTSGELTYQDGAWLTGVPAAYDAITFPGDAEPTRVVGFPLQEVVSVPRHISVRRVQSVAAAGLVTRLATPMTPAMIESLPEGPSEADRRKQRFSIVIDAVSADGKAARGIVRGLDTYGTTAVIAAEAAHRLAVGTTRPGVLAPAEAFDSADFLDWLAPFGLSWSIEPAK